jgi:hypothetical protein
MMLLAQYAKYINYVGCVLLKGNTNHCSCIDVLVKKDYNPNNQSSFSVNKHLQIDEYFQPEKEAQLIQSLHLSIANAQSTVALRDGSYQKILKPPSC